MRPPGPEPCTWYRSTPSSRARRRVAGPAGAGVASSPSSPGRFPGLPGNLDDSEATAFSPSVSATRAVLAAAGAGAAGDVFGAGAGAFAVGAGAPAAFAAVGTATAAVFFSVAAAGAA